MLCLAIVGQSCLRSEDYTGAANGSKDPNPDVVHDARIRHMSAVSSDESGQNNPAGQTYD